jgi:hypothetical protein
MWCGGVVVWCGVVWCVCGVRKSRWAGEETTDVQWKKKGVNATNDGWSVAGIDAIACCARALD